MEEDVGTIPISTQEERCACKSTHLEHFKPQLTLMPGRFLGNYVFTGYKDNLLTA
jgi:hypothetical protein